MIEEYGYAYVAGNSLLSVFGSDEDMEIPIRGDDEITYQQLNKAGRWMNWGNLIVGLLWIIIGLLSVFQYYDHVVYILLFNGECLKKRPLPCGAYSCDPIL